MYAFDEDLVDRAITYYTKVHCFGDLDEEFYLETWYGCYGKPALEACIVLDFLDALAEEVYEDVIPKAR
jgi:hypothetical protein